MSRLLSGSLAFVLACSLAVALNSVGGVGAKTTKAPPQATVSSTLNAGDALDAAGAQLMHSIAVLNPYIVRNADGSLVLSAPSTVLKTIPSTDLSTLSRSLAITNEGVGAGTLITSTGGLVRPAGVNSLAFQDGSTGVYDHWWGISFCLSHQDMQDAKLGVYSGFLMTVLALAVPYLGVTIDAALVMFYAFDLGNGSCLNDSYGELWFSWQ